MRRLSAAAASPGRFGGVPAALLLVVAGCHGHGTGLTNANCSAVFAPGEGAAAVTMGSGGAFDLDFGPLLLGQEQRQQIAISNVGLAPLHPSLQSPAASTGFSVEFSSSEALQPGAPSLVLTVRFHPTVGGPTSAQVSVVTDCPGGNLTLNLKGEGYQPLLVVDPPMLDFGRVLLGSQEPRDLKITNDSDAARALTLFPLQGDGSGLFRLLAAPPAMLAPHEQVTLTVIFRPTEAGRIPIQSALAVALDCTGCQAQVDLRAQGVLTGLSVTPNPIDFGSVTPLDSATANLMLENVANAPITLLVVPTIVQTAPDAFQLGSQAPAADTVLQAGDKVLVPLIFTAGGLGQHEATVLLTTNDPYQGNVAVPMVGTSGGPQLKCTPESVGFGAVGVGTPALARVTCVNAGIGNDVDSSQNLFLTIDTDAPDFSAVFDSPLPPDGLWPGPLSKAVIDVTFKPSVARGEQGDLVLTSNDATTPILMIPLQGTGVSLPPCVFGVAPAFLDFGQVGRGLSRDLPFVVADTGTVDCLVNGLDLSPGSDPAFSLPGGPVISQRLGPVGNTSGLPSELDVVVRFAPPMNPDRAYVTGTEAESFNGQVAFSISDPGAPMHSVSLEGVSPDDCLIFDPLIPNLGSVPYDLAKQHWCSATRTMTVTNVCNQDATLTSLSVDGGAGSSSDFTISGPGGEGPWTIPSLPDGGAPVRFQITFLPSGAGAVREGLVASSLQVIETPTISKDPAYAPGICPFPGKIVTHPKIEAHITMLGEARADGGQIDSFVGRGTQVDLLWIVDTTDATPWQFAPSDLAPFFQFPIANGIDFQMGVTSVSAVGVIPAVDVIQDFGSLEPCDHCWIQGSAASIVSPLSSPDPASVLAPLLSIGGISDFSQVNNVDGDTGFDDQFFESFTEALAPDLLATHNAGFLRANSVLAVVALGGEDNDQSNGSFSFFYNFLAGVKAKDLVSFSLAVDSAHESHGGYPYDCENTLAGLMVRLTGGVNVDASQPGWTTQLALVWPRIGDQLLRYPLSSLPADPSPYDATAHPGGLQVQVGGKAVANSSWQYDSVGNALIFEPATAPPAGAALTVGYALGCGG